MLREEKDAPNVTTKLEKEDELTTLDDTAKTVTEDRERATKTPNKHSIIIIIIIIFFASAFQAVYSKQKSYKNIIQLITIQNNGLKSS
jgi:hypothetical protein